MRKVITVFAILLFLCGAALLLYPSYQQLRFRNESSEKIEKFHQSIDVQQPRQETTTTPETELPEERVFSELYQAFEEYNAQLAENGQGPLYGKGGYEKFPISLQEHGFPDDMIGYLTIPAVDMETPVYLGANNANLIAGATVMGYTSAPIGGEGTNCVIAGHNNWSGAKLFQRIEQLVPGDEVCITTPWETRRYLMVSAAVISDDDFDSICIQPGKDLLTLMTCHYQGREKMRYVVYCEYAD